VTNQVSASAGGLWLHVDINSYFATLLQQEVPSLRGKPIAVVKDAGRTCVSAASKEAKLYGVRTGSRLHEARQRCPEILALPANFSQYLSATKQLKTLFESLAPDVEIFSLDEAFIWHYPLRRLYPDPLVFGTIIQNRIRQVLGSWVSANVGIGPNRFLAKVSSETSPKGSVSLVNEDNRDALLASVSFADVCGIGPRLERRLRRIGVTVPYQLNFIEDVVLERFFGPYWSKQLRKMGQGEEPDLLQRIDALEHMKSVGRSITGYHLCDDEAIIRRVFYNLVAEVIYKVRKMNLAGRLVSVALMGHSGLYWSDHVTLKRYIRHTSEMFDIVYRQLYRSWERDFPIIKFMVRLSLLKPWDETPKEWFPDWWQQEKIAVAIDKLTTKYGLFTVTSGVFAGTGKEAIIRPEVTGFLGDKNFQFME
jgi:DNA polymerase-4